MIDILEQFGDRVNSWPGQPIGNCIATFFIYQKGENHTGICLIEGSYYSHPFDHLPSPYEVEIHFQSDERLKKHYRQ